MAAASDGTDHDWATRHARTEPTETGRIVEVPDELIEDWDLRHAETKGRS
jgi:hypothetical protein